MNKKNLHSTLVDIAILSIIRSSPGMAIALEELIKALTEQFTFCNEDIAEAINDLIHREYIYIGDCGGELEPIVGMGWCFHTTLDECHRAGCLVQNPMSC